MLGRRKKKLVAWARWCAGVGPGFKGERLWGREGQDTTIDYCRECRANGGCPTIDACPEPKLLPDAQPGVAAYLLVHTQWNVGGLGQRVGMRYEGCIAMLERRLPSWQAEDPKVFGALTVDDLLADVQIIETAMLGADAERSEAERKQRELDAMMRAGRS